MLLALTGRRGDSLNTGSILYVSLADGVMVFDDGERVAIEYILDDVGLEVYNIEDATTIILEDGREFAVAEIESVMA